MFLLSRAIDRGDLRSAGVSRFTAKPLQSYRSPSLAPASFGRLLLGWPTILGYYPLDPGCFRQEPLGYFPMLRLVTPTPLSCSMLSATPGCRLALAISAPSVLPAPIIKGSARSQNSNSRGYGSDSGHTTFTSQDSSVSPSGTQTTGRLTRPYPEGTTCLLAGSLSTLNQRQVRTIKIVKFMCSDELPEGKIKR